MGHPTQIIVCGLLAMAHAIASVLGSMSKDFLLQTEFGIEDIGVPPRACPHFVLSFAMLSLVVEYPRLNGNARGIIDTVPISIDDALTPFDREHLGNVNPIWWESPDDLSHGED